MTKSLHVNISLLQLYMSHPNCTVYGYGARPTYLKPNTLNPSIPTKWTGSVSCSPLRAPQDGLSSSPYSPQSHLKGSNHLSYDAHMMPQKSRTHVNYFQVTVADLVHDP